MFHLLLRYWIATWRSRAAQFRVGILSLSAAILAWYAPAAALPASPTPLQPCGIRYRGLQTGAKRHLGKGTIMHNLVLKRFQVKNFRSIENSNWIPVERVTCFVGRNESGKTALLNAIYKLNPASPEPFNPLANFRVTASREILKRAPTGQFVLQISS